MKRIFQLAVCLLYTSTTVFSQDLAYKIPENAFTVASLKGEHLWQLSSIADFDQSVWGVKLLKKLSREMDIDYKSIGELGINLSSNSYYYYQYTDSMNYSGFVMPVNDVKKVDLLFEHYAKLEGNGYKYIMPDPTSFVTWNGQMLFILSGRLNHQFLDDSTVAARYGLKPLAESDYQDDVIIDTTIQENAIVEAPAPVPPLYKEDTQTYEERQAITDSLRLKWLINYAVQLIDKKEGAPSILNKPAYQRSIDKNALASFWMSDMQSIYSSFLPYTLMKYGSLTQGYGSLIAQLYMDNNQIKITGELGMDDTKAAVYKAITRQKLNRKFLNYINSDSLIGFMSYAINTEAYLNNLPKLFKGFYGVYDEEMEMAMDFLSLALDEKALSHVVKGDAVFILSGLREREVPFKSYAYNEETFTYTDSMIVKKETMPDFLCMFSTDNTQFIERCLVYGMKKELVYLHDGIYSINKFLKSTFEMHMVVKDGIVFIGTSKDEISSIKNGTFKPVVDKQQKELLLRNNMSLFFNPRQLGSRLPEGLRDAGNVYMKTAGIKDGYVSMDLVADVPQGKENALKYFFEVLSQMEQLK